MTIPIPAQINALRLLGHFWLEEVTVKDRETIVALPALAETLPDLDEAALDNLAVEYQRLFGFNLPPYESIFIDPSAMLLAPATERIQMLYREVNWQLPAGVRTGAPDHLGVEVLALADGLAARVENPLSLTPAQDPISRLQVAHLPLWVPPFVFALKRLEPHPFYATLADLTCELLLAMLPDPPLIKADALFPDLPPPPVYRGSDDTVTEQFEPEMDSDSEEPPPSPTLRRLIKQFLPPREAGLYITRQDLARISQALDLPIAMGERYRMLDTLFRQAGQYELVPTLLDQLGALVTDTRQAYSQLAEEYPAWQPYNLAWQARLRGTEGVLAELKEVVEG